MFYCVPTADFRKSFYLGANHYAYKTFGAHPCHSSGKEELWNFAVWAPNAKKVSLIGTFNEWNKERHPMLRQYDGIWELQLNAHTLRLSDIRSPFSAYQYAILGADDVWRIKSDPFAFWSEKRPAHASCLYNLSGYSWGDADWLQQRGSYRPHSSPLHIYELHAGSWKRHADGSFYSYSELADSLIPYVLKMGFTHIELLPVMEHPLDRSWGYQITGFFSASSRYGTPDQLRFLIDRCHQAGIGVILDWVPAHFPRDSFGLSVFDGTDLYNNADPAKSDLPLWGTLHFDFSRGAVRSFLLSSVCFWIEQFHADGIRVDAVSNILYDQRHVESNQPAPETPELIENKDGMQFLALMNQVVHQQFPGVLMIAEDSSSFSGVTAPIEKGGLGFDFKWNMGWMNDTLSYVSHPFDQRRKQHQLLTFSLMYAFNEQFILPLSHDECVYGKKSLLNRQPGTPEQKFSGMKAMYGYMMAHPGKKLFFMGGEFGQFAEWNYDGPLDWFLTSSQQHDELLRCIKHLNHLYRQIPALHELDDSWDGFQWLSADDAKNSVLCFLRKDRVGSSLLCLVNFSPNFYQDYVIQLPAAGSLKQCFSTDAPEYGGSDRCSKPDQIPVQSREDGSSFFTAAVSIPPLSCAYYHYDQHARNGAESSIYPGKDSRSIPAPARFFSGKCSNPVTVSYHK